jgi:hypothetical protein
MKRWPNILRLPLTQGDGDRRVLYLTLVSRARFAVVVRLHENRSARVSLSNNHALLILQAHTHAHMRRALYTQLYT